MSNPSPTAPSHPLDNAYLLLTLTALQWAGNAVAGKIAVGEISPMVLTTARWLGVVILMGLVARKQLRADWPVLKTRLGYLALLGALGFTGFNALFYLSAHSTTALNIGILQGSIPVFVLVGAYLVFRTPVSLLQMLGVAITFSGVILVAVRGDLQQLLRFAFNPGDALMVLACLLYSSYTVALRHRPQVAALSMFSVMALAALIAALPLLALEIQRDAAVWPTKVGWGVVLYVTLFPSFLAQVFFMRGVQLIGPGRAGIFVNLVPIFASGLAVLILGEAFRWFHALALALVLGGIWLAERRRVVDGG